MKEISRRMALCAVYGRLDIRRGGAHMQGSLGLISLTTFSGKLCRVS